MPQIKEIRLQMGLSQSQFADYFNIPVKTIQNWEIERTQPPVYVLDMIIRILRCEQTIRDLKKEAAYEQFDS